MADKNTVTTEDGTEIPVNSAANDKKVDADKINAWGGLASNIGGAFADIWSATKGNKGPDVVHYHNEGDGDSKDNGGIGFLGGVLILGGFIVVGGAIYLLTRPKNK